MMNPEPVTLWLIRLLPKSHQVTVLYSSFKSDRKTQNDHSKSLHFIGKEKKPTLSEGHLSLKFTYNLKKNKKSRKTSEAQSQDDTNLKRLKKMTGLKSFNSHVLGLAKK